MDISSILKEKAAGQPEKQQIVLRDVFKLKEDKENFYATDDLADTKESIREFGVLQPVLIRRDAFGNDILVAGHRRRKCCIELVNEGMEERRMIPCTYLKKSELEDKYGTEGREISEQLALIQTNSFREKTEWEKMEETMRLLKLVKRLRELGEAKGNGKARDTVAETMNISKTKVAKYQAIYNNLHWELMEAFKNNQITISIAEEAAKLPETWQQDAATLLHAREILSLEDVQKLRSQYEDSRQIPGQINIDDVKCQSNSDITGINTGNKGHSIEECIDAFYDYMTDHMKKVCRDEDKNLLATMLYEKYRNSGHVSESLEYSGRGQYIVFNHLYGEKYEHQLTWTALAIGLVGKYGCKKQVKIVPVNAPEKSTSKVSESDTVEKVVENVEKVQYSYFQVLGVLASENSWLKQFLEADMPEEKIREKQIIVDALGLLKAQMRG